MQSESQVILNSPSISIVMATYNGERYLTQQIESHLAQNYPNLEFIYVDDASTDATWEILQSFQKNDSRIKIFQNETNLGFIKTFEKGIQLATSDLIGLSDQDDVWMAYKITQLFESMGSFSLVYSDSELIDENENLIGRKMSDIKKQIAYSSPLMYTFGAWAPGHGMLFNRNIIPTNFKFPTYVTHDYCLGFLATCQGGIQYIPKSLVHYRQHTNNVIGANTKSNKSKKNRAQKRLAIQQRISFLAQNCPEELTKEKSIFKQLEECFLKNDLLSKVKRVFLVFQFRDIMLAYKNKSEVALFFYPFKLLFNIY